MTPSEELRVVVKQRNYWRTKCLVVLSLTKGSREQIDELVAENDRLTEELRKRRLSLYTRQKT